MTVSPLHVDEPLPEDFRRNATTTWADALTLARQLHNDSMPEYAGSVWCNGHLWIMAQEYAGTDPILSAALLLVLSEQDGFLEGRFPE